MFKLLLPGAAAVAALTAAPAMATPPLPPPPPPPAPPSWLVTPAESTCHTDFELTSRSGQSVGVALVSDGRAVELAFSKEEVPERAFLPVRVNQKAFSNLVVRTGEPGRARMLLSDETVAALRKGGALQVGWLADEPVSAPLSGSDQGITDLKTCGAQVAAQRARRIEAQAESKARQEADARAQALAAEQLAVVRAQREAAEAERERQAAEAERQRVLARAEQRRDWEADQAARARVYEPAYEPEPRWEPPPPPPRYLPPGQGWGWRGY